MQCGHVTPWLKLSATSLWFLVPSVMWTSCFFAGVPTIATSHLLCTQHTPPGLPCSPIPAAGNTTFAPTVFQISTWTWLPLGDFPWPTRPRRAPPAPALCSLRSWAWTWAARVRWVVGCGLQQGWGQQVWSRLLGCDSWLRRSPALCPQSSHCTSRASFSPINSGNSRLHLGRLLWTLSDFACIHCVLQTAPNPQQVPPSGNSDWPRCL